MSIRGLENSTSAMRRVLIAAYTDEPKNWIGKQMTLYCDPAVTWAGVRVGGIRISHLSGLEGPRTFVLTQTRGKKSEFVIKPLSASEQAYIADATGEIGRAESVEMLKAIGFILAKKSRPVQNALRPVYAARLAELQGGTNEAQTHVEEPAS